MSTIFCGDLSHNNGPANVNKSLKKYCNFIFIDTKSKNKIKMLLLFLKKVVRCNVVIFSCNYRTNYLFFKIAKLLKKKTIYLMHGYAGYEVIINKSKNPQTSIKRENYVHQKTDLILAVSENYMNWFLSKKPELKIKTHFLTNGIDLSNYKNIKQNDNTREKIIAVCGANRSIKHNGIIAKTVTELNKSNYNCKLNIYGYIYPDGDEINEDSNVMIRGRIPQNQLFDELSNTKLFIVNSIHESFGLSVIDALVCGCNVLISKNSGIISIMDVNENDIIQDVNNKEEIKNKIIYNLENNNNMRLLKSIDFEHYSCESSAKRLEKIVECINKDVDYSSIR